jgi:geranylgeranyl pyrophosphate synthase
VSVSEQVSGIVDAAGSYVPRLLARTEQRLRELAASRCDDLAMHAGATIAAGGKRLRPLLVLLAGGPDADEAALVRAAVAVELVHSATLVHDDVLDDASLRRGRPTVFAEAGRAMATAVGDLLFAAAFAELAEGGDAAPVRALSEASTALARGELLQREDAWRADVPLERYLHRCELKTAKLFEAACAMGEAARVAAARHDGDAPVGDPAPLARFGRRTGLAFQILDDVLDVSGPAERTGKHRGTDLLDGTVTLPFILARDRDPQLAALDPRTITTPTQAEAVCDAIAATGALDAAREQALEMVAEAKAGLPAAVDPAQRRALELVADSVVARYS